MSIPSKIIVKKKIKTQRFEKGKIAKALGNILKLSSMPIRCNSDISIPDKIVKWPRYMKIFIAHSNPHTIRLIGITKTARRYFYPLGLRLDKLITPEQAMLVCEKT